jgi:hypothetical protein
MSDTEVAAIEAFALAAKGKANRGRGTGRARGAGTDIHLPKNNCATHSRGMLSGTAIVALIRCTRSVGASRLAVARRACRTTGHVASAIAKALLVTHMTQRDGPAMEAAIVRARMYGHVEGLS